MKRQIQLTWFPFLCAFEGLAAFAWLISIPSEGGTFSPARLVLLAFILFIFGIWIFIGMRRIPVPDGLTRPVFIISSTLLSLTFGLFLFFLRYLDPERLLPFYQRLSPLLWYLLVLSIQIVFFLIYLKNGFHLSAVGPRKQVFLLALTAFVILMLVFLFVTITRLGITPDPAYWGEPGVAMLGWQFALALLGGIIVLVMTLYLKQTVLDACLPLAIYIISISIWLSVPLDVLANGFYVTIDPPAFQPFPYSDAGYYDRLAHSLLIGHPYLGEIPARPLYIVVLAILHKLFGENYPNIIIGQTFLLAFLPVVLYFLGKKLHSRIAGAVIALFFIFRELTSLLITSSARVTNTKSLLVDLPTLLLLLLSCYFTLRWLERRDNKSAFVAGGVFGLLLLLRTQSLTVFPFILLAGLFVFGWKNRSLYVQISFLLLGIVAALLPWLTHNYLLTGKVALDANFQYKLIASQYAYTGNLDFDAVDLQGKSVAQVLVTFTLKDPGFVFGFITNHFLATEIDGLLVLPLIKPYNGILQPVNLYWLKWDGSLEWYNIALMIFYLAVIALGFGAAWKRWRWAGLLPLAYNIGYTLGNAVSRFSGWRYDFPADWVPYFYFGIGFAELVILVSALFGAVDAPQEQAKASRWQVPIPVFFMLFAIIGAFPWMAEKLSSPRYANQSPAYLEGQIGSISGAPASDEIQGFIVQPEAFMQAGRVLYPRFFSRGRGLSSSNPWPAYQPRDYPRLGFLLLNQQLTYAIFPSREIPAPFPHAGDAIVLGCWHEDYVEVRMIAFPALDAALISTPLSEPCFP